jgi:hypothetical protein
MRRFNNPGLIQFYEVVNILRKLLVRLVRILVVNMHRKLVVSLTGFSNLVKEILNKIIV